MKSNISSLEAFLPQVTAYEIEQLGLFEEAVDSINITPLKQHWQSQFCESVGYPDTDLPWTQLRLSQFDIGSSIKTACCIDPVTMQLTHRGAYMVGPCQLNLTQNDAMRIVAQINEQLMRQGEKLYLLDKNSWLFTSEKSLSLESPCIQDLIGKDMFNFSYGGSDADYWQQLTIEIQMLIKQMIDYQGLSEQAPETMINVHCFDPVQIEQQETIPFLNKKAITMISDNELIGSFCCKTFLAFKTFTQFKNNEPFENSKKHKIIFVAFDSEKEIYPDLIGAWLTSNRSNNLKNCQIICQDAVIHYKNETGFFKKLFATKR